MIKVTTKDGHVGFYLQCGERHRGPFLILAGRGSAAVRCESCQVEVVGWDALKAINPDYLARIRAMELACGGFAVLCEPSTDEISRNVFRVEFHAAKGDLEKL